MLIATAAPRAEIVDLVFPGGGHGADGIG